MGNYENREYALSTERTLRSACTTTLRCQTQDIRTTDPRLTQPQLIMVNPGHCVHVPGARHPPVPACRGKRCSQETSGRGPEGEEPLSAQSTCPSRREGPLRRDLRRSGGRGGGPGCGLCLPSAPWPSRPLQSEESSPRFSRPRCRYRIPRSACRSARTSRSPSEILHSLCPGDMIDLPGKMGSHCPMNSCIHMWVEGRVSRPGSQPSHDDGRHSWDAHARFVVPRAPSPRTIAVCLMARIEDTGWARYAKNFRSISVPGHDDEQSPRLNPVRLSDCVCTGNESSCGSWTLR